MSSATLQALEYPQASSSRSSISSSSTLHEHHVHGDKTLDTPLSDLSSPPLSRQATLTTSPVPKMLALYPGDGTATSPFLVDFLPDDPDVPYNWSKPRRWFVVAIIAISTLCISFASSSYSAAIKSIGENFKGTNVETGISGISVYVLGFGVGPLVWAPLSELVGRRIAFNASYPLFALFNLLGAVAPNVTTIIIARFLAGTFGSAPLTNAGAQIGDMFPVSERALAITIFSLAPFLGPVLGPIIGGFVSEARGFRWVFWVQFFFAITMLILSFIFVPETYAPTLLRAKAAKLQKEAQAEGRQEVYIAKYDQVKKPLGEVIRVGMSRPFAMIFHEIIVFCLGLYAAIIYGTLYLFFTAYPIVFEQYRGWSKGIAGLAFLGIGVGLILGNLITPLGNKYYNRAVLLAQSQDLPTPPEARLPLCCVGAILLPIGLFTFAWTCTPNVHWIVPILASVPFGTGFLLIFSAINMYLIDSYSLYAASALASNAVMRSLFGAAFPMFSVKLYQGLGLNWAGTLVGCLSLACAPMPFLFYKYGASLQQNSKYAPSKEVISGRATVPEVEPKMKLQV